MLVAPQVRGNRVRVDRPEVRSQLAQLSRLGLQKRAEQGIELRRLVEQQLEQAELHGEVEHASSLPAVGQQHDAQIRLRQEGHLGDKAQRASTVADDGLAV